VLFYREREYRSMYSWRPDHLPAASAGSPFAPEDLFGLKEEALDGLTLTMRRK
jgi:hypothetical protein